jgi:hypothetical protein
VKRDRKNIAKKRAQKALRKGFLDGFCSPLSFLFGEPPEYYARLKEMKFEPTVSRAWSNVGGYLQHAIDKERRNHDTAA